MHQSGGKILHTVCPVCRQNIYRLTPAVFAQSCFKCGHKWQADYTEVAGVPPQFILPGEEETPAAVRQRIFKEATGAGSFFKRLRLLNLQRLKALTQARINLIYVPMYAVKGVYAATWNEHRDKRVKKRKYNQTTGRYEQVTAKKDYIVHQSDTGNFEVLISAHNLADLPAVMQSCADILVTSVTDAQAFADCPPDENRALTVSADLSAAKAYQTYGNKGVKKHLAQSIKGTRLSVKTEADTTHSPCVLVPFYYGHADWEQGLECAGCNAAGRFNLESSRPLVSGILPIATALIAGGLCGFLTQMSQGGIMAAGGMAGLLTYALLLIRQNKVVGELAESLHRPAQ